MKGFLSRFTCVLAVVLLGQATAHGALLMTFESYTPGTLGTQDGWGAAYQSPVATIVTSPVIDGTKSLELSSSSPGFTGAIARAFQPSEVPGGALTQNGATFSYLQQITVHGGGRSYGLLLSNVVSGSSPIGVGFSGGNIIAIGTGNTTFGSYSLSANDLYLVEITVQFTGHTFAAKATNLTTNAAPSTISNVPWLNTVSSLTGFAFRTDQGMTALFDNVATPEPASLALLGLGGVAMLRRGRVQ